MHLPFINCEVCNLELLVAPIYLKNINVISTLILIRSGQNRTLDSKARAIYVDILAVNEIVYLVFHIQNIEIFMYKNRNKY